MGSLWNSQQPHPCFVGGAVSLFVIALDARCCQVLPRINTAAGTRNDVVHRKRWSASTTVGTFHAIATHDVLAGELDLFERNAQVSAKAYHRRERIGDAHGADMAIGALFYELGLGKKQQHQCLLGTADTNGLVRLIEDKHLAVER